MASQAALIAMDDKDRFMPEFDRPFRSLSPEEQFAFRVKKGVDLILTPDGRRCAWIMKKASRDNALNALKNKDVRMSQLAEAIPTHHTALLELVRKYTSKDYKDGGREIFKAILEHIDALGVDE